MIEAMTLVSANLFQDLIYKFEASGGFTYILPFLLIFALIFGILQRMNLFTSMTADIGADGKPVAGSVKAHPNRSVNAVIAIAVAFMAIRLSIVDTFFREIFPRLGVGLSILLVAVILLGMFITNENWVFYILLGGAAIVFAVVLTNSSLAAGFSGADWFYNNWEYILGAAILIGLIAMIVFPSSGGSKTPAEEEAELEKMASLFFRPWAKK